MTSRFSKREDGVTSPVNGKSDYFSPSRDRMDRERERTERASARTEIGTDNGTLSRKTGAALRGSATESGSNDGMLGFSDITNQIYRRAVKRGFHFTLMVAGSPGLGKSTLINSMFTTDIYSPQYPGPSARPAQTVRIDSTRVLLTENSISLTLTLVDTPGFKRHSQDWHPIKEYIEQKFEEYLDADTRIHRSVPDGRVHCLLYFISNNPQQQQLDPFDIQVMKELSDKVNIVPIISKADTFLPAELAEFKKNIMKSLEEHKIGIYQFPESDDETEAKAQKLYADRVPFAVIGSNFITEVDGQRKRVRRYPWGDAEVDSLAHNDFAALRKMLLNYHMLDMVERTESQLYENYRFKRMTVVGANNGQAGGQQPQPMGGDAKSIKYIIKNPLAEMEQERLSQEQKLKDMEKDMYDVFTAKTKEKQDKMRELEQELERKHARDVANLEDQRRRISQQRQELMKQREAFDLVEKQMNEVRNATVDSRDGAEKVKEKKKKGIF